MSRTMGFELVRILQDSQELMPGRLGLPVLDMLKKNSPDVS
jgi:hypothetical protein